MDVLYTDDYIIFCPYWPMRGWFWNSWDSLDRSISCCFSPSSSLSRVAWGTLHPHPFKPERLVSRKLGSRSWDTGSKVDPPWSSSPSDMSSFGCLIKILVTFFTRQNVKHVKLKIKVNKHMTQPEVITNFDLDNDYKYLIYIEHY